MQPPTRDQILKHLELMNWQGHVELPFDDMHWLAGELATRLAPGENEICEVCGTPSICANLPIGRICGDCLDVATEQLDADRELMES